MSKRVLFTCVILLLLGCMGTYDVLANFVAGRIQINFAALFVPISIGLGMGQRWARPAADWVFGFCYLMLLLLVALSGFSKASAPFPGGFAMVLVFTSVVGSLFAALHWMIHTQPFDEYLGE